MLNACGSGFDPSYPTGNKADGKITISSGKVTVTGTAAATGTKGISADTDIEISGGTINITTAGAGAKYTNTTGATDSYSSVAISGDANVIISGGSLTTSSSGIAAKGIKSDGQVTIGSATGNPTLKITTTGARLLVSGTDYSHPKTLVAAKATIINHGNNTFNSTDDGIHSDTSVTINGGTNTVSAISSTSGVGEGIEAPIITLAGGVNNIRFPMMALTPLTERCPVEQNLTTGAIFTLLAVSILLPEVMPSTATETSQLPAGQPSSTGQQTNPKKRLTSMVILM